MCLVIYKPAHARIDDVLLESAAAFNPHGFGLMAFPDAGHIAVHRQPHTSVDDLIRLCREYERRECVVHLRYRTHGAVDLRNTQPLAITDGIYMVHNGWIPIDRRDEQLSDTWHLIDDYLRPILRHRAATLYERAFHDLIKSWTGPHNRFVFMDAHRQKTVIVNDEAGCHLGDLWLSNTRWLDGSRFDWFRARQQPVPTRELSFLS